MDRRSFLKAAGVAGAALLVPTDAAAARPPLVRGLASRDDADPRLASFNPRARWADLQPAPFGPIAHPNAIDDAVDAGVPFRVRLDAGRFSPDWVLEMGQVTIVDPVGGGGGSMGEHAVPLWWTTDFLDAHDDLLRRLGHLYDGLVSAFTLCAPMTLYCEPFLKQSPEPTTRANLEAVGYTADRDRRSFFRAIDMHARYFEKTRTVLTLNPAQTYDPVAGLWDNGDLDHMTRIADRFLERLGRLAILQNDSLNRSRVAGEGAPTYPDMFRYMRKHRTRGVPIAFQTSVLGLIGPDPIADLQWAIEKAITWRAHLVELPPGYTLTDDQIAAYDAALRAP